MREIKFKGKRVDNNEWVQGYLLYENFDGNIAPSPYIVEKCFFDALGREHMVIQKCHEVKPETISQYTGVMELCENDIIVFERPHDGFRSEDFQIIFKNGSFVFQRLDDITHQFNLSDKEAIDSLKYIVIKGNAYD